MVLSTELIMFSYLASFRAGVSPASERVRFIAVYIEKVKLHYWWKRGNVKNRMKSVCQYRRN